MNPHNKTVHAVAASLALIFTISAQAGVTPADKCEASKNKTAGAYYSCREKAEAGAIRAGTSPDYAKCSTKFDDKWEAAETGGAGDCPDAVLTMQMNDFLAAQATQAAEIIAGAADIPDCGDDVVNVPGEQCDGVDLHGAACTTLAYDVGDLACTAGCTFDAADCRRCPAGTAPFHGACWLLAAPLGVEGVGDCDAACAAIGGTCDEVALRSAGSNGTEEECQAVLDVVDPGYAPHGIAGFSPRDVTGCGDASDYAVGCVLATNVPIYDHVALRNLHDGSGTLCGADYAGGGCALMANWRRACACTD